MASHFRRSEMIVLTFRTRLYETFKILSIINFAHLLYVCMLLRRSTVTTSETNYVQKLNFCGNVHYNASNNSAASEHELKIKFHIFDRPDHRKLELIDIPDFRLVLCSSDIRSQCK